MRNRNPGNPRLRADRKLLFVRPDPLLLPFLARHRQPQDVHYRWWTSSRHSITTSEQGHRTDTAFYDFPAEHWKHIRTTNPIESVFATVRNRTRKTKGCLNRKTALAMVFRLMMSAKKKWRKISGPNRLPEVIQGVVFKDGIKQLQVAA
ncbi:transposase [Roseobacter sp. AzwK-3b]|uniref:transposase n=1 Tax=Roseobacter sp. AzwK-3b TaxID=351016 RepID=UPI001E576EF9|nr:transposase [Roseobacter sp. AzwK-3b]